ncbi:MAG: Chromosome partition protein Smc [Anaerolineales bacterium]|nr:Chromosome partition protein Smc [Anaerolineales bacterium]
MIRIRRIRANNFKQLSEVDLSLPPEGRFLVQGKNEAGKSTLFEAAFFAIFGYPLVTETGTRRLDDLIRYGVEEAYVELWLDAPGRTLKIRRTIVRAKANDWQLDVVRSGDPSTGSGHRIEEVRGNRPVNNRIVDELGFDADALLNTAFVEQKKLDKLEGMARAQREQSLMKLLNLEQMTDMEDEFKLRGDDRLALQRTEQRAELAKVQAERPKKQYRLDEIEHQLVFIELKRALEATLRERAATGRLSAEIDELTAQQAKLAEQAEQAEQLREGLQTAREIYSLRERTTDLANEIQRMEQELKETQKLRGETLPELVKEREALQLLRDRVTRVTELQTEHQDLQAQVEKLDDQLTALEETAERLAERQARERELRTTIDDEEAELQQADYLTSAHRAREALQDWIAAQEVAETPARQEAALDEARGHHATLSRRLGQEVIGLGAGIVLAVLLTQIASGIAVGFLLVVATILLGILAWRVLNATRALSAVSERIGQLQGERQALAAAAERNQAKLDAAGQRLRDLNAIVPSTVERGRRAVAELGERLADRALEALQSDTDAARERLARARALHEESDREIEELQAALGDTEAPALHQRLRKLRRHATETEAALQTQRDRAAQLAEASGIKPDLGVVEGRLGALENEIRNVERRTATTEENEEELASRQDNVDELWGRIEALYAELAKLDAALPAWDRADAADQIMRAGKALRQAYEEAGGDSVRQELREVQTAIGRKEGERNTRRKQADAHLADARSHMQRLTLDEELPNKPTDEDLTSWVKRIEHLDVEDEQALQDQRDDLRERVGYLREQQQTLESTLGLAGEDLDVETTQGKLKAKQRELEVRQKAQEIVELARRRVVEQILPSTMEHMRKVLPALTMQRYYDAELTEDYRIRVWDERAGQGGDWKEKNIFSGGTKDQLSLALRLAFALATLPEERGSAPSFIFLDEPLSSFDDERARALLHLLTEGEIAQSFDQIFLISHVRVNPELFSYHITIDQGRIAESDLPETEQGS